MAQPVLKSLVACLLAAALPCMPAQAGITFLGEGSIAGDATDGSGLTGLLEDGVTPANQVGGLGSAIAYTGRGNLYVATPDRGPADGTTSYIDRIYTLRIDVTTNGGGYTVSPTLVSTRLMRQAPGVYFTGSAAAFDAVNSPQGSLRLDPEGVRVSQCGRSIYVSDEYGPFLYEFDLASGKRLASLPLPNKFLIDAPASDPNLELSVNLAGRQANRGMEGLAISPDGGKLFGIMQSALIQDGGLDANLKRVGTNNRIVEWDLLSGEVHEYLYQLDGKSYGVSEILAVNDHELLVLERDGKAGADAAFKKVFRIDLSGASDIRSLQKMDASGAPSGVAPVGKSLFLDFLDPAFGLAGAGFPEKMEGLAFGPDLADGRHLLIVTNDNDFKADTGNRFFAFAIDAADLPGFQAQQVGCPR